MINSSSAELREWAVRCEEMAFSTVEETERARLLRKSEALRALADSEDWLAGLSPGSPSAENPALASGRRAHADR